MILSTNCFSTTLGTNPETAVTPGWAHAFGIHDRITEAQVARQPGRVQGFVGWDNEARSPNFDHEWEDYTLTMGVFYNAWMSGFALDECISIASKVHPPEPYNNVLLHFPLGKPFPWNQYHWPYNYRPFRIKVYGYVGITRMGYKQGRDQSPYY